MRIKRLVSAVAAVALLALAITASAARNTEDTVDFTTASWGICNPASRVVCSTATATEDAGDYTQITVKGASNYKGAYHGNAYLSNASGSSAETLTSGIKIAENKIRFHYNTKNITILYGDSIKSAASWRGVNVLASCVYTPSGAEADATGSLAVTAGSVSQTISITEGQWYEVICVAEYSESGTDVSVVLSDGTNTTTVSGTTTNTYELNNIVVTTTSNGATTGIVDVKDVTVYTVAASDSNVIDITSGVETISKKQTEEYSSNYATNILHNSTDNIDISSDTSNTIWTVTNAEGNVVDGANIDNGVLTLDTKYPVGETKLIIKVSRASSVDEIEITVNNEQEIFENANVTINYYIKGTTESVPTLASTTEEYAVGLTIDSVITDDIRTETDKYVYDSTNVELPYTVVSGENVINVYYTQVPKYTVNIVPSVDTTMILDSDTIISGDSMSYAYPRYITAGENLYKCNVEACRASATITSADSIVIDYVLEDTGKYTFYEIDGGYTTRTTPSNGSAGSADRSFDVPEDGVYTIIVNGYGGSSKRTIDIYKNSASGEFIANLSNADQIDNIGSNGNDLSIYAGGTTITENNVVLTANDKIWVEGSASTAYIDYVLLKKTGDVSNVTIDAPNASIIGLTEGYIAQNTYTATVTADLGYKVTAVTVNGEEVTANEDGTYTITADSAETTIAVTTEVDEDVWIFSGKTGDEWNEKWQNANIFFTYNQLQEDGTTAMITKPETETKTLYGFLVTDLGKELPTFSGTAEIQFALKIQRNVENVELTKVWLEYSKEEVVTLSTGAFDPDAEIDEAEYIEIGDFGFDVMD